MSQVTSPRTPGVNPLFPGEGGARGWRLPLAVSLVFNPLRTVLAAALTAPSRVRLV